MTILVGDVGGTNARFAVISAHDGALELIAEETLPSGKFPSLGDALAVFLERCPAAREVERACFGLAGPILGDRCETTNLPWVVEGADLARTLGLDAPGAGGSVELLNDVEAAAWGLAVLGPNGIHPLAEGRPDARGNRALVAPGTGLGAAVLFWQGGRYHPFATEGGHTDFAPADELQVELWRYLHGRHGHVSWERVVSGPGLIAIYRFFLERAGEPPPAWLAHELAEGDAAAAITAQAHGDDGACELCARALELFFRLLGAEAGNLALSMLATGGVYLAGGIVSKLLPELAASGFLDAFTAKGRFRPVLEEIPVRAVVDDRLALWGAAAHAAGVCDPRRVRCVEAIPPPLELVPDKTA